MAAIPTGVQLREPMWLVALILVAALAVLLAWRRRHDGVPWADAGVLAGSTEPLPVSWRQRLAAGPLALRLAALALLVLALARPVQVEVEPPSRLGRDVLLCLDRSSSMTRSDDAVAPARASSESRASSQSRSTSETRLASGKRMAAEFLLGRVDDRVGIVTFARYADLVCPPTADRAACSELLATIEPVDPEGPEDATAIGAAVGLAAERLQRSDAVGKVIVLLTDGEENVATAGAVGEIAPLHAGQWCRDQGIRVHCITVGRGEQQADGSFLAVDTTAVQQLAKISGGQFYRAADAEALRAVYAQIDRLEAVQFAEPGTRVIEWFALPSVLGLLLLLLAHLWQCSRMGELR